MWITGKWEQYHRRLPFEVLSRLLSPADKLWIIDRPLDISTGLRTPQRFKTKLLTSENGINILTPRLLFHDQIAYRHPIIESVNLKLFKQQLKTIKRPDSHKVYWIMHPSFWPYSRFIDNGFILYDCYDEFTQTPDRETHHLLRLYEDVLLRRANLTLVASEIVKERKMSKTSHLKHIPNPTDVSLFAQARKKQSLPQDLQDIPEPRIAYVGGIKPALDFELLEFLFQSLPKVSFVFIGPIIAKANIQPLLKYVNFHYLGYKKYSELPAYLSGMKLGLIPYQLDEYTRMLQPNKAIEYLSAGLKVIGTPIPGLKNILPNYIYLSSDNKQLLHAINTELNTPSPPISLSELEHFSWDYYLEPMISQFRTHFK